MITLKTSKGDIKIKLFEKEAPITVKNFLDYIDAGFYKNEADNQLSNKRGTLAMARTSVVDSATAQFFINLVDNDFLDFKAPTPQHFGYCVFGEVVEGMDVVDQIAAVKTGSHQMHRDVPTENIVILDAVRD